MTRRLPDKRQSVSQMCLVHYRTIMPKRLAAKVTNKTRDLFQACATVAAGGFVQGLSFAT